MADLIVITRDGTEHVVAGRSGSTIMEIVRDNGFDELLALCGGSCACATCHVFVHPEHLSRLPPLGDDESELLESSPHRTQFSRLSCQLRFEDDLSGLHVQIAPEE